MSKPRIVSIFVLVTALVMAVSLIGASSWNGWRAPSTVDAKTVALEAAKLKAEGQTGEAAALGEHAAPIRTPAPEATLKMAKATAAHMPTSEIQARLEQIGPETGGPERVEMESALGYALLGSEQPDLRRVGKAFTTALDYTPTPDARVPMAKDFGTALLDRQGEIEAIDVTAGGRFIGAELTPERVQIELIRGIAYDALGLSIRAQDTFHDAFETILGTTLHEDERGRDVARTLGLRLARKYRDAGDPALAKGVSTRLRAWLGEEDLVLR